MKPDSELLHQYAFAHSEAAFTELVGRHLPLVYNAALRQLGGNHNAAQDVAQDVFSDLARKAGSLSHRPNLAGWLHTGTRFAASKRRRYEWTRRKYETEAHDMNQLLANEDPGPDWQKLRPAIDDSIGELDPSDQEAVLMRYFQNRPYSDIGTSLGISADAARMRIDRALARLEMSLNRRGLGSCSAAAFLAMTCQAATAVPATLVTAIAGTAMKAAPAVTLLTLMSTSKLLAGGGLILAAGLALLVAVPRQKPTSASPENIPGLPRLPSLGTPGSISTPTEVTPDATSAIPVAPARPGADESRPFENEFVPVASMENVGRATAARAFETALWASAVGNYEEVAATLTMSPQARGKAESILAALGDADRAITPTPERLFALFFAKEIVGKIQSVRIAETATQNADFVTLTGRAILSPSQRTSDSPFPFVRESGQWRLLVPDDLPEMIQRSNARRSPRAVVPPP